MPRAPVRSRRWWWPLALVWLAAAAYVGTRVDRGLVPLDEGILGRSAERALAGQLPQRDFDDVYTGGLSRADALVFRVTGTRLVNLRWAIFAVFLLRVPALFYIASRFTGATDAALVTLLCVIWSVPSYPAAMPSWYNFFFATFGMLRSSDSRRPIGLDGYLRLAWQVDCRCSYPSRRAKHDAVVFAADGFDPGGGPPQAFLGFGRGRELRCPVDR